MSLDDALSRAEAGDDLSRDDLIAVLSARGSDLDAVLDVAGDLRDHGLREAGRPGIFTYSRKVFVPVTTLCRDRCHYCVFVDTPGQLQRAGKRAVLLFVVQRADCDSVEPADEIDPAYGEALRKAADAGVEVLAVGARVTARAIALERTLPVRL